MDINQLLAQATQQAPQGVQSPDAVTNKVMGTQPQVDPQVMQLLQQLMNGDIQGPPMPHALSKEMGPIVDSINPQIMDQAYKAVESLGQEGFGGDGSMELVTQLALMLQQQGDGNDAEMDGDPDDMAGQEAYRASGEDAGGMRGNAPRRMQQEQLSDPMGKPYDLENPVDVDKLLQDIMGDEANGYQTLQQARPGINDDRIAQMGMVQDNPDDIIAMAKGQLEPIGGGADPEQLSKFLEGLIGKMIPSVGMPRQR